MRRVFQHVVQLHIKYAGLVAVTDHVAARLAEGIAQRYVRCSWQNSIVLKFEKGKSQGEKKRTPLRDSSRW